MALCANDYVQGPRLWEKDSIALRWAEQPPEQLQHYTALAEAAVRAFLDG